MVRYASLDAIKAASVEELAETPSMNRQAAEAVYQYFRKGSGSYNDVTAHGVSSNS